MIGKNDPGTDRLERSIDWTGYQKGYENDN